MKKIITLLITLSVFSTVWAQSPTFPRNGVYDERPEMYAFTNATIYVDARTVLENATLLIKNVTRTASFKDTMKSLGMPDSRIEELGVLNQMQPNDPVTQGTLIKVISK